MADERIRLLLDMGHSAADAEKVVVALDKLDAATKKAGGGVAGMGQSLLQTGRVVQDFAQGGIGGILNNIEGLTQALGGTAGLAGALTVVGVAFAILRKPVMDMIASFGEGDDAARAQAAAVESLTEAGKKLKDHLGELRAVSDLHVKQMRAENDELERQVKIEEARLAGKRKIADQEAKEQAKAAGMEGEPSLEARSRAPSEKRRAEELMKAIGGDPEAGIIRRRIELAIQNNPLFRLANQATRDAERDRVLGAFYAGHVDALNMVINNLLAAGGQEGEGPLRGRLEQLTPGAEMAQRGRNIAGTLEGFARRAQNKVGTEAAKRMAEAKRARDRRNQEVRDLEQEYLQGNEEMDADAARAMRRFVDPAKNKLKQQSEEELHEADRRGWINLMSALQNQVMTQQGGMANSRQQAMFNRLQQRAFGPNASDEAVQAAMIRNQEQITANMAAFQAKQDRLEGVSRQQQRIGQRLENNPMPAGNGR